MVGFECILIIIIAYRNVPPFASRSKPSSGSAEHPDFEDANFMPSFAKFPTYFTVDEKMKKKKQT